ncbi:MAG: amidohydrolase family protein [Acetobacterales bacterium]
MTKPIAGPIADTKKPDLASPPGACDCHAHIFGPSDRFPYTEGRGYTPPDSPVEKYLAMLDAMGFERGVAVQGNAHGYDNAAILDAVKRFPKRLRAVAIVGPDTQPDDLVPLRAVGVAGLRFHHFYGEEKPNYTRGVGLDVFERLYPKMRDLGMHMQIWTDLRTLDDIADRIRELEIPVVMDHMGHQAIGAGTETPGFRELLGLLGEGKCWVKLSGAYRRSTDYPHYPDARQYHDALVRTNPDQLVWGTDWPHPNVAAEKMPNDGVLLDLFNAWTPDAETRRRILVDNPARLYGFD